MRVVSRFVEVDGLRGHCLEAGEGRTVVILASMLVRASSYLPLLRQLSRRFRVLALAMPGSGRTPEPGAPFSFEQYAAWAARFLEQEQLTDAVVVGHSNSGAVAMLLGADESSRLAGIVLADPVGAHPQLGFGSVVWGRFVDALLEPVLSVTRGWHLIANLVLRPRTFWHQVWLGCHAELLDTARRVRVPTLLAWGRFDYTMPLACLRRFQEALPSAQSLVVPASHDWLITRPRWFARGVEAFIEAVPSLPTRLSVCTTSDRGIPEK